MKKNCFSNKNKKNITTPTFEMKNQNKGIEDILDIDRFPLS